MTATRILSGAAALACVLALALSAARAKASDYRFELVGKPQLSAKKDILQIRLVRVSDGKPVPDAVVFETKADMAPMGMPTMTAPIKATAPKDGAYRFEVEPGMAGTWAITLAAKVQGESETVRGTINADLVK